MLQRIRIEGIRFPRLYIAENMNDVRLAKESGIPFIRWNEGMESLIRMILRPTLEKMFPGIDWNKALGYRRKVKSKVIITETSDDDEMHCDIADYDANKMLESQYDYDKHVDHGLDAVRPMFGKDRDEVYERTVGVSKDRRVCAGGTTSNDYNTFHTQKMLKLEDYVGDMSSSVDIDALQKLGMLPKFMGDITDCIKTNLSNSMRWSEGYNKKLGVPIGRFNNKHELPNLVIIDISASIPDGVAATMITLADTLRSQCNAELIITSCRSGYYPIGAKLPKAQTIRDYYDRGNESCEFIGILNKHIAGREFGNVISFGDNDCPTGEYWQSKSFYIPPVLAGTKVHAVYHYHTGSEIQRTGYAEWVHACSPMVEEHHDTSWCNFVNRSYIM